MSTLTNFPLCWPAGWKRATSRKRAKFASVGRTVEGRRGWNTQLTVAQALKRVIAELSRMRVPDWNVIVSTNIQTRRDGLPYSNQPEPRDPGAAVYWKADDTGEQKCMAIDRYDRVADNLAAIAATIEAMRAIERHGGAEILERAFLGFQALPPPIEWQKILGVEGRDVNLDVVEDAYRARAMQVHPDRAGGDVEKFQELNGAIQEARRFFGAGA